MTATSRRQKEAPWPNLPDLTVHYPQRSNPA
jgi:hypothetical protein